MGDERADAVRRSWAHIVDWCAQHAPATAAAFQGPAEEAALADAQDASGSVWPEQLTAWLRMNDGGGRSLSSDVMPLGFLPLGVEWILRSWRMMVDITGEIHPAEEVTAAEAQPAGSRASPFLRSWLPIGDDTCGDMLFLDLRPGPRYGCVSHYEHDNGGFTRQPMWDDIASMLGNLADAIRAGRWVHPHDPNFDRIRTVEDGRLRWHFGPATEWKRAHPPIQTIEELSQRALLLSFSGRTDDQVAAELGLSAAQMADVRAARDHQGERRRQEIEADGQDED